MASPVGASFKSRRNMLFSEPIHFQRAKGRKKVKKKRIKKKINIKFGHIFLFFSLLAGIFYLLQQSFLFLMSWDYLDVKETEIICSREEVRKEIGYFLKEKNLGNILLLDIGHLQQELNAYKWVKEAHIRKILPSSLWIEIKEREPAAILKKESLYLIDEKGVQLEKIYSRANLHLPLLIDSNNFQNNYEEKIKLAWECLKDLSPAEKEKIEALDLTYYGWVTLFLKDKETRIILDYSNFAQEFNLFYEQLDDYEARFGPLEYVDLRFQDRLYLKPLENKDRSGIPIPKKEAL